MAFTIKRKAYGYLFPSILLGMDLEAVISWELNAYSNCISKWISQALILFHLKQHTTGFIANQLTFYEGLSKSPLTDAMKSKLINFVGNIKQHICYQLWKFKLDTLIIIHFIIENNLYGMLTRRSLRWVPWRSTTSLFFNVTLYTLKHFWLGTQ